MYRDEDMAPFKETRQITSPAHGLLDTRVLPSLVGEGGRGSVAKVARDGHDHDHVHDDHGHDDHGGGDGGDGHGHEDAKQDDSGSGDGDCDDDKPDGDSESSPPEEPSPTTIQVVAPVSVSVSTAEPATQTIWMVSTSVNVMTSTQWETATAWETATETATNWVSATAWASSTAWVSATTTSWVSMTTTSVVPLPTQTEPRKGLEPDFSLPDSTSGSSWPESSGSSGDSESYRHSSSGGLSPSGEHALIAAGSIGAFILVCFVGWVIFRTLKKSPNRRGSYGDRILGNLPWRRDRQDPRWDERSMFAANEAALGYEKSSRSSMHSGYYGSEKMAAQSQVGSMARPNTSLSQRSLIPHHMATGAVVMIPVEQYAAMSQNMTPAVGSESIRSQTPDGWYRQQPDLARQLGPSEAQTRTDESEESERSRMPDAYFNQSEFARQPSDAYSPEQRQVYRASELSSLSSGFGDTDIIVPETLLKPAPVSTNMRQSSNFVGRFSWMSQSRSNPGDRETVYTTSSEDTPARYRTVSSWVNQQVGRIKRADARKQPDEDIPAVPDLPEQVSSAQQQQQQQLQQQSQRQFLPGPT